MVVDTRNTKYTDAVLDFLMNNGHATNPQIAKVLRKQWPDVSDTTVHRITARLAERGILAIAPKDTDGNMRYDVNIQPHHHFYCACCDALRDIQLDAQLMQQLEDSLGGCKLNGQLLINGACGKCALKITSKE